MNAITPTTPVASVPSSSLFCLEKLPDDLLKYCIRAFFSPKAAISMLSASKRFEKIKRSDAALWKCAIQHDFLLLPNPYQVRSALQISIRKRLPEDVYYRLYATLKTSPLSWYSLKTAFKHPVTSVIIDPAGSFAVSLQRESMQREDWLPETVFLNAPHIATDSTGTYWATGSWRKGVGIWERTRLGIVHRVADLTGDSGMTTVAIGPEMECVITGSYSGQVRIWKKVGGHWKTTQKFAFRHWIYEVAMDLTGTKIAVACADGKVSILEKSGKFWDKSILTGHKKDVAAVAFSSTGKQAISGSWDNNVRLWSLQKGVWKAAAILQGHTDAVSVVKMHKKFIVSGSDDFSARVWKEKSPGEWVTLLTLPHSAEVNSVAIDPKSTYVLTACQDGTVGMWSLNVRLLTPKKKRKASPCSPEEQKQSRGQLRRV